MNILDTLHAEHAVVVDKLKRVQEDYTRILQKLGVSGKHVVRLKEWIKKLEGASTEALKLVGDELVAVRAKLAASEAELTRVNADFKTHGGVLLDTEAKLARVERLAGKDGVRHLSPHMALQEIRGIIRGDVLICDQSPAALDGGG